jgi:hypothetical protein
MEEVPLEKAVDLVVVMELSTTLLKMLDPVETRILNPWGKTFLYATAVNFTREGTWSV